MGLAKTGRVVAVCLMGMGFGTATHKRAIALLFSLAFAIVCEAAPTLSTMDRARLLEERSFHLLGESTPIPDEAVRLCADGNGRFAMPGARWAPTDVLSRGGTLPSRRLVWAAASADMLVVHFEQGGFAHTYQVVVLRMLRNATTYDVTWRASSPRLKDYANFVRALRTNDLQDEPDLPR